MQQLFIKFFEPLLATKKRDCFGDSNSNYDSSSIKSSKIKESMFAEEY
jgi:hypothetical protein